MAEKSLEGEEIFEEKRIEWETGKKGNKKEEGKEDGMRNGKVRR